LALLFVSLVGGVGFIGGATVYFAVTRQSLGDLQTYILAARALLAGQSPYDPISAFTNPAYNEALYRYPPVFASWLAPVAYLPFTLTGLIYSGALFGALVAGMALALRAGGAPLTKLTWAILIAIALWFVPDWSMLWATNVGGFQALLLGVSLASTSPRARASAIAANAWLKVAPVALLPALLARHGRSALVWVMATSVLLVVPSLVLAPRAWADLPTVLFSTASGGLDVTSNLAPAALLSDFGLSAFVGPVRIGELILALTLVVLSVVLARRPTGWPAALMAGTAGSLLAPAILWRHYFVMLLPLALFAYPRASRGQRLALIYSGLALDVAQWIGRPVELGAAALLATVTLIILWPRTLTQSDPLTTQV
jgi:hypothetical protein